ncbi:hypothetical protein FH972_001553 [Carpinus fangiana]|uniref:Uncharacterized protein n=1 Tax=Carpinus fangiana TaxID=176857 RepID=A0A5N6QDX3_9ROSI|nr:hypothetical protein FH972_001553 [Carpinus fangiana]
MKEGKRPAGESSVEWASLGAEAASFLWSCEWPANPSPNHRRQRESIGRHPVRALVTHGGTDPRARQQEKSQEIALALGNSDDGALGRYGVYGSGSSIGVGCDGGQLALPDRMAEKMMAAACRGEEVLGGAVPRG